MSSEHNITKEIAAPAESLIKGNKNKKVKVVCKDNTFPDASVDLLETMGSKMKELVTKMSTTTAIVLKDRVDELGDVEMKEFQHLYQYHSQFVLGGSAINKDEEELCIQHFKNKTVPELKALLKTARALGMSDVDIEIEELLKTATETTGPAKFMCC